MASAKAIKNAVGMSMNMVKQNINKLIETRIKANGDLKPSEAEIRQDNE